MADIQRARSRQTAFRISSSFIYHLGRRAVSENSCVGLLTAVTLHTHLNSLPASDTTLFSKCAETHPHCTRKIFSCGGGLEYLHRSPASRKRELSGPTCSWGIKIRGPGPPGWGSLR
jgi:hypothetical protein